MAERTQKQKPAPSKTEEVVEEAPAASKQGEKLKAELDDLLDVLLLAGRCRLLLLLSLWHDE